MSCAWWKTKVASIVVIPSFQWGVVKVKAKFHREKDKK
jgi:hypothetical protein